MNTSVVLLMLFVLVQVLAFQFASVRLGRTLPAAMVGTSGLPQELSARIRDFRKRTGRSRWILGAALCLAALLVALVLPLDTRQRTVALALISLLSSATLVISFARDYTSIRSLWRQLPEPAFRLASLGPRSLRSYYSPLWEIVPAGIFVLIVAGTIWFPHRSGALAAAHPASIRIWLQPLIGLIVLGGLFALGWYRAVVRSCVTPESKAFHESPEAALRFDQRLRELEMRQSIISRAGIAVLLAIIQYRTLLAAEGSPVPVWSGTALLGIAVVLMAFFVRYSIALNRAK